MRKTKRNQRVIDRYHHHHLKKKNHYFLCVSGNLVHVVAQNCIPRIQFVSFSSNTSPIAYAHVSALIERTQKMGHVKLFIGSCHLCAASRVLFNCRLYQEKEKKIPRHSSSTIFFLIAFIFQIVLLVKDCPKRKIVFFFFEGNQLGKWPDKSKEMTNRSSSTYAPMEWSCVFFFFPE